MKNRYDRVYTCIYHKPYLSLEPVNFETHCRVWRNTGRLHDDAVYGGYLLTEERIERVLKEV